MINPSTVTLVESVAKVVIDSVLAFLKDAQNGGATIDDAIAALQAAEGKTWEQYKAEAAAAAGVTPGNPVIDLAKEGLPTEVALPPTEPPVTTGGEATPSPS
jgi:hypothetical protein